MFTFSRTSKNGQVIICSLQNHFQATSFDAEFHSSNYNFSIKIIGMSVVRKQDFIYVGKYLRRKNESSNESMPKMVNKSPP